MKKVVIALIALLALNACQSIGITDDPKVLSRPKAAAIIKQSPAMQKLVMIKFEVQPYNPQILVAQHFGYMETGKLALTEKGRQLWRDWGFQVDEHIVPVARAQFVQITGISASGSTAEVHFTWQWEPNDAGKALVIGSPEFNALPNDIQTKLRQPMPGVMMLPFGGSTSGIEYGGVRKGTSNFELFDDGWRARDVYTF